MFVFSVYNNLKLYSNTYVHIWYIQCLLSICTFIYYLYIYIYLNIIYIKYIYYRYYKSYIFQKYTFMKIASVVFLWNVYLPSEKSNFAFVASDCEFRDGQMCNLTSSKVNLDAPWGTGHKNWMLMLLIALCWLLLVEEIRLTTWGWQFIPLFTTGCINPSWLARFLPSTVSCSQHLKFQVTKNTWLAKLLMSISVCKLGCNKSGALGKRRLYW